MFHIFLRGRHTGTSCLLPELTMLHGSNRRLDLIPGAFVILLLVGCVRSGGTSAADNNGAPDDNASASQSADAGDDRSTDGHPGQTDSVEDVATELLQSIRDDDFEAQRVSVVESEWREAAVRQLRAAIDARVGDIEHTDKGAVVRYWLLKDTRIGVWPVNLSREGGRWQAEFGRFETNQYRERVDRWCLQGLADVVRRVRAEEPDRPLPSSTGPAFWLALCVGDGPGDGNLHLTGDGHPDQYLRIHDALWYLRSPGDPDTLTTNELRAVLSGALDDGSGVAGIDEVARTAACSYAGPTRAGVFASNDDPVVGASGDHFQTGFNYVRASGEARFVTYREATEEWGWPEGTRRPRYGTGPLRFVVGHDPLPDGTTVTPDSSHQLPTGEGRKLSDIDPARNSPEGVFARYWKATTEEDMVAGVRCLSPASRQTLLQEAILQFVDDPFSSMAEDERLALEESMEGVGVDLDEEGDARFAGVTDWIAVAEAVEAWRATYRPRERPQPGPLSSNLEVWLRGLKVDGDHATATVVAVWNGVENNGNEVRFECVDGVWYIDP